MSFSVECIAVAPAAPDPALLARLASELQTRLGVPCTVRSDTLDATFAVDYLRNGQCHSTAILRKLMDLPTSPSPNTVVLGVTRADLYVPILSFVFGEAQLDGGAAVISSFRLREEFYGLPSDYARLEERLLKEALHEIGHTRGLRHCDDWRCVMSSSHRVERVDLKESEFCPTCWAQLRRAVTGAP